jgi:predicted  nucleic acid-binding Zn-ribbon protein
MQETLRLLRGLQELDRDLFQVKEELRRLPAELERRRAGIALKAERLAGLEREQFQIRVRIKEIEDLTTSQRQRLRKLENEAAGSRADTALLVAYQHEMRTLKRDISEAEEEGLSLVEKAEGMTQEADSQRAEIASDERDFAELRANIEREISDAERRHEELAAERKRRFSGPVQQEVLLQYERLLEAREGQAMAVLEGRVCQGCYVAVPNNIYVRLARGTELVTCPSCNRILYLPD